MKKLSITMWINTARWEYVDNNPNIVRTREQVKVKASSFEDAAKIYSDMSVSYGEEGESIRLVAVKLGSTYISTQLFWKEVKAAEILNEVK